MATGTDRVQVGDHTEGSQDMDLTCIEGGTELPESTYSLINYKFPVTSTPGFGRGIFNPQDNPFLREDRKPGGLGNEDPSSDNQTGRERMDKTSEGKSEPSGVVRESRKREYPGDEQNQEWKKKQNSGVIGSSSNVSLHFQEKAGKDSWEREGDKITQRLQQISVGQQDPEGISKGMDGKRPSKDGYQAPRSVKLAPLEEHYNSQQPVNFMQAEQGKSYYMGPTEPSLASEAKLIKPRKTPGDYDGTTAWTSYISHFEVCAKLNCWSLQEMGMYLAASLTGAAREVLVNLDWKDKTDYFQLVRCLEQRFDPEHQEEMFRAELKGRTRKPKETIPELVQDIRKLAHRAYPNAAHALLETLTKDHFMDSIVDPEMRWKIFQSRPGTLDEAARTALEFEVFQKAEAQRSGKKYVRMATSQEQKIQSSEKEIQ